MSSYFVNRDWSKHSENVFEARDFIDIRQRKQLIEYFERQDTSCILHGHTHHTPENSEIGDAFFWDAKCFEGYEPTVLGDYSTFDGIGSLLYQMRDAATRHSGQPMQLTKVVFHKYKTGSSGPEHADIYPLATLLYLNDDYQGGALYFPNQELYVSPGAGSLLAFNGGADYKHGVKKITEGNRYVLVAFWDYEDQSELSKFWAGEHEKEDQENEIINKRSNYLRSLHPRANVLFADKFPILEIKMFVSEQMSENLIKYMSKNDIELDECFGPPCFPEYYRIAYGEEPTPQLVPGITTDTLGEINEQIKALVAGFLGWSEEEIKFSKFKGHNHKTMSYSPPHGHPPAVAVGIVSLNSDYEGGELFIPSFDIQFDLEPYSLYIFPEGEAVKNGVKQVTSGNRYTLVSHWQSADNPYNKAGANV